jgi:predicted Zn-dependent protease with MMP-like domain
MTRPPFGPPPSAADLQVLADAAFGGIPAVLRRLVQGVAILIEDFPDDATLKEMGVESPFDLLGLYQGVALAHKGTGLVAHDVDRIFLYRRPLLDYWCETGETLEAVVRHVLIHEIGHHFGLSDDDMEAIEAQAPG